jgi:LysM repeat protein
MNIKGFILLVSVSIVGSVFLSAQIPKDSVIVHLVKKGETLSSIASKYGITVSQLKQANIGQKFSIGVNYSIPRKTNPTSIQTDSLTITIGDGHANAESVELSVKTHTVKQGENLQAIAYRYKTTTQNLVRWNELKSKNLIIGQKIIVSGTNNINPTEQWNKTNRLSTPLEPLYQTTNKQPLNQFEETGFLHLTTEVIHPTLPIGTMVLVTNLESKSQVLARVAAKGLLPNESIIGLTSQLINALQLTNENYVQIQYYLP